MPLRQYGSRLSTGVYYFYEDFIGTNYDNRWWFGRGSGGSISNQDNSVLRVRATAGNIYELYQNDLTDFSVAAFAALTSRWRVSATTSMSGEIGLEAASPDNGTDWIAFIFNTDVGANWLAQSATGGLVTTVDTGVAANTNFHEFRIATTSSAITYFLDGRLVATITTNISPLLLQPYCYVVSKGGASRDVLFDWIEAVCEREA